jgi:DNA processing protein
MESSMTVDEAVALTLLDSLPRPGLAARLFSGDPQLHELAQPLLAQAAEVHRRAAADGLGFLPWNDPGFPAGLLAISDCPPGLWYRGDPRCLASPLVAIVGSRAGSAVALEMATLLAEGLAASGVAVVSGLARGVDSAAHRGALRSGRTVAVLGSGIRRIYPNEHRPLATEIAASGLILSEYPPESPPLQFHFPMRNRLISGLSRAVIVIEAAEESGSLITAACALEQGREVMAVPGNPLSGRNRGGHALIRDGARIVECAADVLVELGMAERPDDVSPNQSTVSKTKSSGDRLLSRLEAGCAYDLDALAAVSGIEPSKLLPRLSDLELDGRVRRVAGGRFMRTA